MGSGAAQITRGLPIDFQIQYSLFERNQLFLKRLEAYALKYASQDKGDGEIVTRAWSFEKRGEPRPEAENFQPSQSDVLEKSLPKTRQMDPNSNVRTTQISFTATRLEVTVIGIIGVLVGFSWFHFDIDGAFGWTLRLSLLATFMFCCLGFFAFYAGPLGVGGLEFAAIGAKNRQV